MSADTDFFETIRDLAGLSVTHSEFVTVSAEGAQRDAYAPLAALLRRLLDSVGVHAVFVAQFLDGVPVVRQRGPQARWLVTRGDAAEAAYGQLALARGSRVPAHCIALPVLSADGQDFGTLCCDAGAHPSRQGLELREVMDSAARTLAQALSGS